MAKLIDLDGLAYFYGKIKAMLAEKLGKNDTAVNASRVNNLTVETAVPKNAKFTDTVYTHPSTHPASMITGLSTVATSGSYNDLTNKPTIVKSVNNVTPDSNGNVTITVSGGGGGGVSTSEVNTWTAEQIFNDVTIGVDAGQLNIISNSTNATPTTSYATVVSDGQLLTLDFSALSTQASGDTPKTIKFKIVIIAWDNIPTLKIINAGNVVVPENTKLGGFLNLLDGMMLFDGNQITTIFHVTNMSHDGENIS